MPEKEETEERERFTVLIDEVKAILRLAVMRCAMLALTQMAERDTLGRKRAIAGTGGKSLLEVCGPDDGNPIQGS